jgi:CDP-glycerol glycerophosphotransferase (TagB/SpsB family)
LINIALKWGWRKKDIIKINLPRWDRYSNIDHYFSGNITSNSILVMFTWRYTKWWDGFRDISDLYHENIIKLLEDPDLLDALKQKNMTMYFSLHRYVNGKYLYRYEKAIKNIENIKKLKQNEISECLAKTNLIVSDFSSIIFDIMSRDKPFVLYVPDENDPTLYKYYTDDYINLIKDMKSGRIKFKNKCNTIKETVNMIIKYINNNFEIEPDLKKFYKSFNFKTNNNSIEFVEYLTNLK